MITTVTFNPALDRTLLVDRVAPGAVNRVRHSGVDAGGKGINVSKVVHFLGEEAVALGFLAGAAGKQLEELLNAAGIPQDFLWTKGATRINTKIVDGLLHTCTDYNEPGPPLCETDLDAIRTKVLEAADASDFLVLSGNVQGGVPDDIYAQLIASVRGRKASVILDASGELLRRGVCASPFLIKPNMAELSDLLRIPLFDAEDTVPACRKLLAETGIRYVCVSNGAKGLILVSEREAYLAVPPAIVPQSTVGAGDSVVACLAVGFLRGLPTADILRSACSVSAACATLPGTGLPAMADVRKLALSVTVRKLA